MQYLQCSREVQPTKPSTRRQIACKSFIHFLVKIVLIFSSATSAEPSFQRASSPVTRRRLRRANRTCSRATAVSPLASKNKRRKPNRPASLIDDHFPSGRRTNACNMYGCRTAVILSRAQVIRRNTHRRAGVHTTHAYIIRCTYEHARTRTPHVRAFNVYTISCVRTLYLERACRLRRSGAGGEREDETCRTTAAADSPTVTDRRPAYYIMYKTVKYTAADNAAKNGGGEDYTPVTEPLRRAA